jgi:hypothetical protein
VVPGPVVLVLVHEFHTLSLTIEAKIGKAAVFTISLAPGLPIIIAVEVPARVTVRVPALVRVAVEVPARVTVRVPAIEVIIVDTVSTVRGAA